MRGKQLGLALFASTVLAGAAGAQEYAYRRFDQPPTDTNRSNRIVYVPLGWAFSGSRPPQQPYDVSVATWYQATPGARADNVLDNGNYVLEQFANGSRPGMLRVVIRRSGPAVQDLPELRVVDRDSLLTTRAQAQVERNGAGVRYVFDVPSPLITSQPQGDRRPGYELRLMTARPDVRLPSYIVRKPTFSGMDPELRRTLPPPQLPYAERVAGKRIEYRSPRSAGRVVEDRQRVAGSREERRR
jgi:hypothetical protein